MKKLTLLILSSVFALNVLAQKTISNPDFIAKSTSGLSVTKVVISDTATVVHMKYKVKKQNWFSAPKSSHIIADANGEKLYITDCIGIELGKYVKVKPNNPATYALVFPPIELQTQSIKFSEGNESGHWTIWGIDLSETSNKATIPDEISGIWNTTDGSKMCFAAFYNEMAIYDSKLWQYEKIKRKKDKITVKLSNEKAEEVVLYLKVNNEESDELFIGDSFKNLESYSKQLIDSDKFRSNNDPEFEEPILNKGTTTYKGFLKGYLPEMGKTGQVSINNIFSGKQNGELIEIHKDGSFEISFEVAYPMLVFVRFPFYSAAVYVEPNKTSFQILDLKDRKIAFMGELAKVNQDMILTRNAKLSTYNKEVKMALDWSADEYKEFQLKTMHKELTKLDELNERKYLSKKAYLIAKNEIRYNRSMDLFELNWRRKSAYRKQHPDDKKMEGLQQIEQDSAYFKPIHDLPVNNPLSLTCTSYKYFINRIMFSDIVRKKQNTPQKVTLDMIFDKMIESGKEFPEDELLLIAKIKEFREASETDTLKLLKYKKELELFTDKYKKDINTTLSAIFKQDRIKGIKNAFPYTDGLLYDIVKTQTIIGSVERNLQPLNNEELIEKQASISNPFISGYIEHYNEQLIAKIENNKHKTGYVVNESPSVEGDKVFNAIMDKYKGKVVYVDFWATWCGPCRSGMKRIQALKEQLKDEDIVFVYITNNSSPEETWENMIPDIKGEHYRVSADEYNYMREKFDITGIPHYVLVGKDGQVKHNYKFHNPKNDELLKVFNEYLKL